MKKTWPRDEITPKINHDSRRLIYACTAVDQTMLNFNDEKKITYFTYATWKAIKEVLLLFSCY